VRSWVDAAIRNEPLEISVVGDFEIEPVIDLAARYFGTLPARHARRSRISDGSGQWLHGFLTDMGLVKDRLPRFPEPGRLDLTVNTKIPKGLVVVAYPSEDFWDIHRTRRLSILADVASDRLRVRIREALGAAYSQYAYNQPSRAYPGYGVFQNYVHINPDDAQMVVTEVQKIMADLARNGVTAEELQRALDPTLTRIKDMLRQNGYWLNNVLTTSVRHPEQLEWNRTFLSDYATITPEDLWALAKKYLVNKKAAVIVVKPAGMIGDDKNIGK
jgi:zinc protease